MVEKIAISLIQSVFPLLCLCFDSLVCDDVSHTVVLQPTSPAPLCCWPLFEPVHTFPPATHSSKMEMSLEALEHRSITVTSDL